MFQTRIQQAMSHRLWTGYGPAKDRLRTGLWTGLTCRACFDCMFRRLCEQAAVQKDSAPSSRHNIQ